MIFSRWTRRAARLRPAWFVALLAVTFGLVCHITRADEAAGGNPENAAVNDPAGGMLQFAFREAPWPEVLQQFADWAGLTLDLTDEPPGTFNYYDNRRRSSGEALGVRLTLAVDKQANELIVSCSDPLFQQISDLVRERGQAALVSRPSVQVIQVPGTGPAQAAAMLQTLQALSPNISVTQTPSPYSQQAPASSGGARGYSSYRQRDDRSRRD